MTALTADKRRSVRNLQGKKIATYTVQTSEVCYHGGLICVATSNGRARAAADTAGVRFAGIAEETATGNTAGTVTVDVSYGYEALINASTALTVAYVGSNAACSTDDDVTTVSAGTSAANICGEVIQIESGDAWVFLRNYSDRNV